MSYSFLITHLLQKIRKLRNVRKQDSLLLVALEHRQAVVRALKQGTKLPNLFSTLTQEI